MKKHLKIALKYLRNLKKYFEQSFERKQLAKYYMSQEETSCPKEKPTFKGRNFLWQEKTSHHSKKLTVTRRSI